MARSTLDAVEAGHLQALGDDVSNQVQAALSEGPDALYPQLGGGRSLV
ncbi:hypothetical protein [Streptomyces spinoverrucosus]|nr:hypothetical protein [Streptomyces spinoverrucosus]